MTQIVPAGREDCCCSSPYNQILEQLTTMQAGITAANTTAGTALATASQEAGNAAASALAAANSASAAAQDASDALAQATAAASSASSAASSLTSIQNTITTTLNTYLAAKVDKLTTSGDFAYTHSTGTQGEIAIVNGTTSNSLPIRDGNGRMQAADPASGATDKTLVTANWISQTGDSAPNNALHRTGNETKAGTLSLSAYEALKFEVGSGNAPCMSGNTAASQRILDQYISYKDNGEWMIRNSIYQAANTKNYSRLLYLRRYDANNNIMQALFTFSIDANGKGHITVNDNDGTTHTVI